MRSEMPLSCRPLKKKTAFLLLLQELLKRNIGPLQANKRWLAKQSGDAMGAHSSTMQVPTCASSASLLLLLPVSSPCVWSVPDKDGASSKSLCPSDEVLSSCTGSETRMLLVVLRLARVTAV